MPQLAECACDNPIHEGTNRSWGTPDATQEDLLCDPCRVMQQCINWRANKRSGKEVDERKSEASA